MGPTGCFRCSLNPKSSFLKHHTFIMGKKHTPAFCDIPHHIKMDSHKPNNSPVNNFLHLTTAPALLQFILMLAWAVWFHTGDDGASSLIITVFYFLSPFSYLLLFLFFYSFMSWWNSKRISFLRLSQTHSSGCQHRRSNSIQFQISFTC